ncbi:MAG: excinuclease ABC subunit UvrA, partial [Chloroflexota bacterium]|nr:excinuclease ABC subunit UvrA [Chloroflexota bacterium]
MPPKPSLTKNIVVKGAREHNLKNVDVTIPRNKLVVITGVSGSGKSSLAFDTIYAEGQRRYVESLSAYARQFLGRMDKPDVDYIEGLSPAISIDQKGTSHNPRSTVGTVTEIFDYLRLLFARIGKPHCYKCGRPVQSQTVQQIVDSITELPVSSRIQILSPVVRRRKGEHKEVFESARKSGFVRVRVNGEIKDLSENFELDKQKWHDIDVVVDRLVITEKMDKVRISDSTEAALKQAGGIVLVDIAGKEEMIFSEAFSCVYCNVSLGEIEPRTFSFNNPHGACGTCTGLGFKMVVDPDLVIPDKSKTIEEGGIEGWSRGGSLSSWHMSQLNSLSEVASFRVDVPIKNIESETLNMIMNGTKTKVKMSYRSRRGRTFRWNRRFEGVIGNLERRYAETESDNVRKDIERYMTSLPCQDCDGQRLKPESLSVTIGKDTIMNVADKSITEATEWIEKLEDSKTLSNRDKSIAAQILKEISGRLQFLLNVGLDYLTLSRTASTLSGGEAQRIRLATQIGSGLMGVLYVCDEPSIGLHPADDHRLINTLKGLRDVGNTVLIVEHDEAIMRAADHIVDLGPGAGEHGGEIVASGTVSKIMNSKYSLTGQYLSGRKVINTPETMRASNGKYLEIKGAEQNNLNSIDVAIPLGILVCITGVSGSGKSTLINEVLYKRLSQHFYRAKDRPGKFKSIEGLENIDKVV